MPAGHKILTWLSWILSVVSALLALVPFWYIWRIIHDLLEAAPDFSGQTRQRPMAGVLCFLQYFLFWSTMLR